MFYFSPLGMLLTLIGLPLVFLPQWWVKRTVETYAQVPSAARRTGAEVARDILRRQGLENVSVEMSHGWLSDHYDPASRTVRLSEDIYGGASVSSVAIAAHEVGHAVQHARGFFPVVVRSAMVPAVNLGSQLGPILIFASILLMGTRLLPPDLALAGAWLGVLLFSLAVLFHIVTLPVEIDASVRAVGILDQSGMLTRQEVPMAKKVLTAAAFTYVATALYSLIQLVYWITVVMGSSRRQN